MQVIDKNGQLADGIPTNMGVQTIPEIIDCLMYSSYRTNRDLGCSHDGLIRIGIGNEAMRQRYESEKRSPAK